MFSIISFSSAETIRINEPICSAIVKNTSENSGKLSMALLDSISSEILGWGETNYEIQAGKGARVDMLVTGEVTATNLRFVVGYIENNELKITDKRDFVTDLPPAVSPVSKFLIPLMIIGMIIGGILLIKAGSKDIYSKTTK